MGRWEGRKKDVAILCDEDIIIIIVPPSNGRGLEGGAYQEQEVDGDNQYGT